MFLVKLKFLYYIILYRDNKTHFISQVQETKIKTVIFNMTDICLEAG